MGMISQKTIDEIKNAADILDVVEFVAYNRQGRTTRGFVPSIMKKHRLSFQRSATGSIVSCGEKATRCLHHEV